MALTRKAKANDGWMTLNAAASALGESRLKVLSLIVKGELTGKHIADRTVVRRDSVDALIAARSESPSAA